MFFLEKNASYVCLAFPKSIINCLMNSLRNIKKENCLVLLYSIEIKQERYFQVVSCMAKITVPFSASCHAHLSKQNWSPGS